MKNKKVLIIGAIVLLSIWAISAQAETTDNGLNDGDAGDDEMKTKEFLRHVKKVIEFEGGYTNDPNDAGGETKYGIAKTYYPHLDIKNLTIQDAIDIYYTDYWQRNRCYNVPRHLRFLVFDSCVTPGPTWSKKALQRLAGVTQDGVIGPVTAQAALQVTAEQFSEARWDYYLQKIANRPQNEKFRQGWYNRTMKSLAYQKSIQ